MQKQSRFSKITKLLSFLTIISLFFSFWPNSAYGSPKSNLETPAPQKWDSEANHLITGELLVKFDKDFEPKRDKKITEEIDPSKMHKLTRGQAAKSLNIYKFEVPAGQEDKFIQKLSKSKNVEYAEQNSKVSVSQTPDDPYYSSTGSWSQPYPDLWGIHKINADLAWDKTTGSAEIPVAVIDTGFDFTHEDLADKVWYNQGEYGEGKETNGIDDDGNGYVDDWRGWDFVNDDNNPTDDHGHGSHVSGTIAANTNNNLGVAGVSWQTKIYPVKFLSGAGGGSTEDAVSALTYAADLGIKISSNSWGGGKSLAINDAVQYAYQKGQAVIVAAGNDRYDASYYSPASSGNAITVGASDYEDKLAVFSNDGPKIDVVAPGVDILSVRAANTQMGNAINDKYTRASGTSMATPHVAGLAALILAQNPSYTPEQIRTALSLGADDLGASGYDTTFGYGRINANNSLTADANRLMPPRIYSPKENASVSPESIIKGYGIVDSKIELYFDNELKFSGTVDSNNEWSIPLAGLTITEGNHQLYALQSIADQSSEPSPIIDLVLDTTAPVISNLIYEDITAESVTLTVNTDEQAKISGYLNGSSYNTGVTLYSDGKFHRYKFYTLSQNQTYQAKIVATDTSGNQSALNFEFKTAPDITPPVISNINIGFGTDLTKIRFQTNETAYSIIQYGLDSSYGQEIESPYNSMHNVSVPGLTPNTNYHFRILATDLSGNTQTTADMTFFTIPVIPNYTETILPQSYTEKGEGLGIIGTDVGKWINFPAGFTFPFFNAVYTSAYVTNKGYISLDKSYLDYTNSESELKNNTIIAAAWSDFRTEGTAQTGEDVYLDKSDENQITFRWKAQTFNGEHPINVSMTLSKMGAITFNYGSGNDSIGNDVLPGFTSGISAGNGLDYLITSNNAKTNLDLAPTSYINTNQKVALTINNGSDFTNTTKVSLNIVGNSPILTGIRISNDNQNWTEVAPTSNIEWELLSEDGSKTVFCQIKLPDGTWGESSSDSIYLDTKAPEGSFAINTGQAYTNNPSAGLTLNYADINSIQSISISNDQTNWSSPEPYTPFRTNWKLDDSTEGQKTVYLKVCDIAGNCTDSVDSITYDATAPNGTMVINNDDSYTTSFNVSLDLSNLTDNVSGLAPMVSITDGLKQAELPLADHISWEMYPWQGQHTIRVNIKDNAGNSRILTDTIQVDTLTPYLNLNISPSQLSSGPISITLLTETVTAVNVEVIQLGQTAPTKINMINNGLDIYGNLKYTANYTIDPSKLGEGKVTATSKDPAGNVTTATQTFNVVDSIAPTGSISINNGAVKIPTPFATLYLFAKDNLGGSGVGYMRFSNDGSTWSSWENYATTKSWLISASAKRNASTYVYAQFRDFAGNISPLYSDSIQYRK